MHSSHAHAELFRASRVHRFFIGVIVSTFASIDACITALTTAFSYDFMNFERQPHEARGENKTMGIAWR